jgi:hypothetical protein
MNRHTAKSENFKLLYTGHKPEPADTQNKSKNIEVERGKQYAKETRDEEETP